jgi:Protein of unknown function (DUF1573)
MARLLMGSQFSRDLRSSEWFLRMDGKNGRDGLWLEGRQPRHARARALPGQWDHAGKGIPSRLDFPQIWAFLGRQIELHCYRMKSMRFCATLILSALTATGVRLAAQTTPPPPSSAAPPASPASSAPGPIIQVDNVMFDFGKVSIGEKVHHTYIVTNTGDATLSITNVHPGCHCTTAGDWTHKIEPGQTGSIPVQFDSTGFNGNIARTIDVYSNAKNEPHKVLRLKGMIWKPIEYASTAMISIPADGSNELSTSIKIVNQTDNALALSNIVSSKSLFTTEIKEIKPGKEFELVVTAHPPYPTANTSGTITINTSLANTPTITLTAMANVTPAVQVSPSQIVLRSVPDRATTNRITIVANTTNLLSLSNPKASDSQIQVDVQPGARKGLFTVMVVTPAGFHLTPGQHAEVTVESNHPRFPVIRIPIMQYPAPKPFAALPKNPNPPPAPSHPQN